jgi:hypothetical protein
MFLTVNRRARVLASFAVAVAIVGGCARAETDSQGSPTQSVRAIYVLDHGPGEGYVSRLVSLRPADLSVMDEWEAGYSPTFAASDDGAIVAIASQDPEGKDWLDVMTVVTGKTTRIPVDGRAIFTGPAFGNPLMTIVGQSILVYSANVLGPDSAAFSVKAYSLTDESAAPTETELGHCEIDAWLLPVSSEALAVVCPGTSEVNILGESAGKLRVVATVPLPRTDAPPGTPAGLNDVVGAEIDPVSNEIIAVTGLGRVFVVDLPGATTDFFVSAIGPGRPHTDGRRRGGRWR